MLLWVESGNVQEGAEQREGLGDVFRRKAVCKMRSYLEIAKDPFDAAESVFGGNIIMIHFDCESND